MQRVTILCVGKLKEKFYIDAAAEYVKRLQRSCKLDIVELPEYRLPEEPSPAEIQKALQAEGAAIRERLPKGGAVVALCIEGKPCSSEELSRRMADFGVQGKTQITFLIGGSGQFGDVWIRFEPNEESEEMVFAEEVFGSCPAASSERCLHSP